MPVSLDSTVGGANANSYETALEAQAYFDTRWPAQTGWTGNVASQNILLMSGTRILDMMAVAHRTLRSEKDGRKFYYTSRAWTGTPATTTQALAWPRIGMYDRNGNAIASDVIPIELKEALAELAGQLGAADLTADNSVIVQGVTSVRAGSVSVTFKEDIAAHVLPDAVLNIMPASWFTDDLVEAAIRAQFGVVSPATCPWPSHRRDC